MTKTYVIVSDVKKNEISNRAIVAQKNFIRCLFLAILNFIILQSFYDVEKLELPKSFVWNY